MLHTYKSYTHRMVALMMAILLAIGALFVNSYPVHAADGTINYQPGHNIAYGDYFTNRMNFDGNNTAYCVEPLKKTPAAGNYSYDLLGKDSPLRKALYYLVGGYGYEKNIKNQYLSGWSEDNAYVIGHLVVAYIYAGYSADTGAFYGAPQSYSDKAVEVANAIKGLPNPPGSFRAFIIPGQGSQTIAGSWYQVPNGWIELYKSSANPSVSNNNSNYSLKGAEYGIYKNDKLVEKLTTNKDGYAKSGELEEGDYTVKELTPSKGFIIDTKSYKVTVKAEETSQAKVTEIPQNNPIDLVLQKLDAELRTNTPQGAASLADAQFTLKFYDVQSEQDPGANGKKPARTWKFKTDAAGELHFTKNYFVSGDDFYYANDGKTICLPLGTVTLQETKAPTGYHPNPNVFVQPIKSEGSKETISVYNAPNVEEPVYRGGVKIQKRDLETHKAEPQGSASLENAEFTITTLNDNPVLVDGKTYTKGQVVLTLITDIHGQASTAKDALPFGHYRVDESKEPTGYLKDSAESVEFDIVKDGEIVDLSGEETSIYNQVIRGDLELVKVSDGDQNRLANVPFKITSKTTGENHVIVTDENGYASTSAEWNKHTQNTNQGKTSQDGIWFGTSAPDDSKGALIYDTYTLEELSCDSNKGMNLLKVDVKVYKNSVTVDLGTMTDDIIDIGTTVLDEDTNSHMSQPKESVTLTDTVEYEGLKKGEKYTLTGTLMDKETGEPLLIDGKPVTSQTEFTAKRSTGSVKVSFTFNGLSLKGKTIVVFEELYQGDVKLAVHTDINDEDQTIYFPEIRTSAKDAETSINISKAGEEVTLIDTLSYKNLVPKQKYQVTGTLMDKESGKPVEIDGKQVTAKTEFAPQEPSGTIDIPFTFNASSLKGKIVVVFESVTYKDKEVAVHADINDEGQTIHFPEIRTTAQDAASGTHNSEPEKEVTITDVVEFKNLVPGKEYKLAGTLMDKETEKPIEVDGKPVTAEASFTPEQPEGTVELSFTFDASALSGKTVVAFETVSYEDKEVAAHTDITDQAQTIYFPEIKTTATDSATGTHTSLAGEKVTILDTVTYTSLEPGKEYKLTGTLMDKETEKPLEIDGKPVTAETAFTPEEPNGTVELSFTFDGSVLKGKTTVVFESVTFEEKEVAVHADLKDTNQTIYFPEISTTATDGKDGDKEAVAEKETILIDTIAYKNLTPGEKYKAVGTLMDKTTKKAVSIDGKPLTAEAEFTAEEAGITEVKFSFSAEDLAGHDVVVFEKLYYIDGKTETEIAFHEDLDDEGQTVKLTEAPKEETPKEEPPSVSTPVKTGDNTNILLYAGIAAAALISAVILLVIYYKKRKKEDNNQ